MVLRTVYFHNGQVIGTVLCGNCATEVEKQSTGRQSSTVSIDGEYFQDMRPLFKDLHKKEKKKKKTQTSSKFEVYLIIIIKDESSHPCLQQQHCCSSKPPYMGPCHGGLEGLGRLLGPIGGIGPPCDPPEGHLHLYVVYPISTCADTARGDAP